MDPESCMQGQGPRGQEAAPVPLHSPGGQARPAGQVSHCTGADGLSCRLKVPVGQARVRVWGLGEPTGHGHL